MCIHTERGATLRLFMHRNPGTHEIPKTGAFKGD